MGALRNRALRPHSLQEWFKKSNKSSQTFEFLRKITRNWFGPGCRTKNFLNCRCLRGPMGPWGPLKPHGPSPSKFLKKMTRNWCRRGLYFLLNNFLIDSPTVCFVSHSKGISRIDLHPDSVCTVGFWGLSRDSGAPPAFSHPWPLHIHGGIPGLCQGYACAKLL